MSPWGPTPLSWRDLRQALPLTKLRALRAPPGSRGGWLCPLLTQTGPWRGPQGSVAIQVWTGQILSVSAPHCCPLPCLCDNSRLNLYLPIHWWLLNCWPSLSGRRLLYLYRALRSNDWLVVFRTFKKGTTQKNGRESSPPPSGAGSGVGSTMPPSGEAALSSLSDPQVKSVFSATVSTRPLLSGTWDVCRQILKSVPSLAHK